MKTGRLTYLSQQQGRVYVRLEGEDIGRRFLEDAQAEGFTFCDGAKPTEREAGYIMAVNPDRTIRYVGHIGAAAFGSGAETVGGEKLIRVDYAEYCAVEKGME